MSVKSGKAITSFHWLLWRSVASLVISDGRSTTFTQTQCLHCVRQLTDHKHTHCYSCTTLAANCSCANNTCNVSCGTMVYHTWSLPPWTLWIIFSVVVGCVYAVYSKTGPSTECLCEGKTNATVAKTLHDCLYSRHPATYSQDWWIIRNQKL